MMNFESHHFIAYGNFFLYRFLNCVGNFLKSQNSVVWLSETSESAIRFISTAYLCYVSLQAVPLTAMYILPTERTPADLTNREHSLPFSPECVPQVDLSSLRLAALRPIWYFDLVLLWVGCFKSWLLLDL